MRKNKTIGVVTFCEAKDNYGQVLQCFALQEFLRKYGYEPFLIKLKLQKQVKQKKEKKTRKILRYLLHFNFYLNLYRQQRKQRLYAKIAKNKKRNFSAFIDKHIVATNDYYDEATLKNNFPQADAYICGSDQIWGFNHHFCYYLDFVPDHSVKIAYAASFGGMNNFSTEYERYVSFLLSRFSFVGCREMSGVRICQRLGREDAVLVVDPTLLLGAVDYDKLLKNNEISNNEKYVLLYLLGNPTSLKVDDVYAYAKKKGYKVIYVASQDQCDKKEKNWATIEEWLSLMKHAELIVTNSFHGTVFSLIFHTPFITVPLVRGFVRMNTRVIELLEGCGMMERLWHPAIFKSTNLEDCNFAGFDNYCQDMVVSSQELLLNQLEKSIQQ